ncbi:hypothetical protein HN937_12070 [Candidatus Poribacteria bacterium]|nr:hypothetical protein [Candidatus Poribacteria bacterium]
MNRRGSSPPSLLDVQGRFGAPPIGGGDLIERGPGEQGPRPYRGSAVTADQTLTIAGGATGTLEMALPTLGDPQSWSEPMWAPDMLLSGVVDPAAGVAITGITWQRVIAHAGIRGPSLVGAQTLAAGLDTAFCTQVPPIGAPSLLRVRIAVAAGPGGNVRVSLAALPVIPERVRT